MDNAFYPFITENQLYLNWTQTGSLEAPIEMHTYILWEMGLT